MAAVSRRWNRMLLQTVRRSATRRVLLGFAPGCCRWAVGGKRYLLTDDVVKLQEFQQVKVAVSSRFHGKKETYFKDMEEKMKKKVLILKEELKTLLHLCETQDDMELTRSAIYRYHAENRNVCFGEFKFGPLFIRLCYELDLEQSAMELIKDQHLHGFFSDCTSFNILMNMLFIKGNYEGALEVLIEMKNQGVRFNTDTYILAFAICYKLNTADSFNICMTLLDEALFKEAVTRRAYGFAIALALKQNQVAKARSIYSHILNPNSKACNNLNILIHAHSGMLEGALQILEASAEKNPFSFVKKEQFSEEVLTTVKEKLEGQPALQARFREIWDKLRASGQVVTQTIDAMLCVVPQSRKLHILSFNKRQTSRRTLQPLSSSLTAE
ncbi:pentatricopeptide repeat-containing protein 2, mitochondrial isoform X1 [Phascolarctos cinereus]|uniref:Pentatricopeptide repeat-containing protein 2, mitochondrial n=1 Tax=Phascolarctos cinereus TaxID=38626 RepID=A0A6P5LBC9_PHACI|nr:pentatricopeptide repeat-containing protein 2, mitochondrial isoform X1 [Phascolarctos cinereus]